MLLQMREIFELSRKEYEAKAVPQHSMKAIGGRGVIAPAHS
jgi:hypothetical protein